MCIIINNFPIIGDHYLFLKPLAITEYLHKSTLSCTLLAYDCIETRKFNHSRINKRSYILYSYIYCHKNIYDKSINISVQFNITSKVVTSIFTLKAINYRSFHTICKYGNKPPYAFSKQK